MTPPPPIRSTDELVRQYIPALVQGVRMLNSTPHIIILAFMLRLRGIRTPRSEMLRKGLGGQHPEQYSGPRYFQFSFCAYLRFDVPAHMEPSFLHGQKCPAKVLGANNRSNIQARGTHCSAFGTYLRFDVPLHLEPRFFRIVLRLENHPPPTYGLFSLGT